MDVVEKAMPIVHPVSSVLLVNSQPRKDNVNCVLSMRLVHPLVHVNVIHVRKVQKPMPHEQDVFVVIQVSILMGPVDVNLVL